MLSQPQRDLLVTGAADLGVTLDDAAVERFSIYLALLQLWGKKINLTTRLETTEVILYHFLDSLAGVPILREAQARRVVDLGSGAGFPSLPLKFSLPELQILQVDSVRKKVSFCQEAIRATRVAGIEAAWGRGEEIGMLQGHHRAFDWAVSRALAASAEVAALALPFLAPGGRILLYKGEPDSRELQDLDTFCSATGGGWLLRRIAVPNLKGARTLITVEVP
jgi:16S rRNA (guanine527-N7)-methyltransferase